MGKAALDSYADYEQLVGGVDTMFKTSSATIQQYADEAYKTAGVSANKYMESVTSFSASLIQSVGEDTTAAAELANMAMVDMSDNANKMGSDMESIQNAYQGFAKQNYTMLDNLKLGYGGTKEEMQRLVATAAENVEAQERLGVSVEANNLSFGNIVQAIHVVQDSLGILGTTSLEAETTISGSIGMLTASFDNLMVGFGNADADITQLCDNVISSFMLVVDNVTPVVENIIDTLPDVLMQLITKISDLLPSLLDTVATLFSEALNMFVSLIPQLVPAATDAVMTVVQTFVDNLPAIITAAGQIISSLGSGIMSALPSLLTPATEAILTIVRGLVQSTPALLEGAVQIIKALVDYVLTPSNIFAILEMALELVRNLAKGLCDAIPHLIDAAAELVLGLVEYLLSPETLGEIINVAIEIIVTLAGGFVTAKGHLIGAVSKLISDILYEFGDTDWAKVGKNIVDGLLDGLKNAWKSLTKWVDNSFDRMVDSVLELLGINSPSKVFAGIGKDMALGVGVGWEKSIDDVREQIDDDMDFDAPSGIDHKRTSSGRSGGVSVVQNIYAQKMTPSEVFAEAKYQQTKAVLFGV